MSEVQRRVAQFAGGTSSSPAVGAPYAVALTRAALFTQKARLFPGCAFVVGVDTARRILDPKVSLYNAVMQKCCICDCTTGTSSTSKCFPFHCELLRCVVACIGCVLTCIGAVKANIA
jgi:hypothetical protein